MEFLAARYGVDLEKLDAIAEFLSTPSVHENSTVQIGKDGEDKTVMRVRAINCEETSDLLCFLNRPYG